MRELTKEELEFVQHAKHAKGYDQEPLNDVEETFTPQNKPCRQFPWRFVVILCGVVLSLPFFFVASMMYGFSRVENVMGHDTMVELSQMTDAKLNAIGSSMGLTGLSQLMDLYRNRELIIGISFLVAFGIIFLVVVLSFVISHRINTRDVRKARKQQKRAKKQEGNHSS